MPPICIICGSRFSPDEDETCECSMEFTAEDAIERPEIEASLVTWWKVHGGKPINEALEAWRVSA